jgi:hypothetical protein
MSRTFAPMFSSCGVAVCVTLASSCASPSGSAARPVRPTVPDCEVDSGHTKAGLYFQCFGAGEEVVIP